MCMSRNGNTNNISAPFFGNQGMFGKLLFNAVGISLRLIHFIYCNYNLNACRLCVIDSLNGLWHNTVICGNNQNGDIGRHSTALTHRSKCGMTGGIKEGNVVSVVIYAVCTDMLGNTAGFGSGNLCITDSVQQRCFTVVNMTHNYNDRTSFFKAFCGIFGIVHNSFFNGNNNRFFYFTTKFHYNDFCSIVINGLSNRCHNTQFHKNLNNLGGSLFKTCGKFANGDFFTNGNRYGSLFNAL